MLSPKNTIISDLIQGNKDGFEKLFHDLFPKLYHYAYDFVKDHDTAREIAHESFVKLWEVRLKLKPDTNPEAFLVTICRNSCLNFIKHKKIVAAFQETKSAEADELAMIEGVLSRQNYSGLDFDILRTSIRKAINNLPEQCRNVFELSRFKKKKYAEIAARLNISQKTVEAHISLALKKLREELKEFL